MAIGANAGRILGMVVRQGAILGASGIAVGVISAVMLTRLMRTLLFGIEPLDVPTFVVTIAVLLAITLLASWLPARRATKVDPVVALRYE
jgi:putative ABC transport system permease protein